VQSRARMATPTRFTLGDFSMRLPRHRIGQGEALEWLARAHAASQSAVDGLPADELLALTARFRKILDRCACGPSKIGMRGSVTTDIGRRDFDALELYDVLRHPHGRGAGVRAQLYAETVNAYFEAEYAQVAHAPSDIIHVTCTGYVSPSGAQRLVASRGWGATTRVTNAYHMGCYAAFPAVRMAAGLAATRLDVGPSAESRVDIVHTELCSLHLDPSNHSIEQLVVQSLFADGFIRYSLREGVPARGEGAHGAVLRVVAMDERILPDSADSMSWTESEWGMQMTLARDVPARIARSLREFVLDLYRKAGMDAATELGRTVFAVHPGGPKIIDGVREVLELSDAQVATSRQVLFDHGNMSSATLPHIWMRLVDDDAVRVGTTVVSLAFGPGLTVCGGVFRKE